MNPKPVEGEFVFCSIPEENLRGLNITPLFLFKEEEGTTIVIKKSIAEANSLQYSDTWALITLNAQPDNQETNSLAEIISALAKKGISVNIVSAVYHDYLFVPFEKAAMALKLLNEKPES